MEQTNQTKKYSEMTFEEFLTDVLKIKLEEPQLHMIRMFEETKTKKVEYINNWIPNTRDIFPNDKPWNLPIVTYGINTENTAIDNLIL